jgi:Ser/Thr protein kinase RdoA (MazF antagonist)
MVFAARRVRELSALELQLLEQAVKATNDGTALRLELDADTAWRDALALSSEHDPDHASPPVKSS